jgi:hypothetical protein
VTGLSPDQLDMLPAETVELWVDYLNIEAEVSKLRRDR